MIVHGMCPLLNVFDMPASLAFYRDVLGFAVVSTSRPDPEPDWVLLRKDGAELMLNTAYERHVRPPDPDPARVAFHGDTGLFFGCRDLDAAYAELRAKGLEVQPPVERDYRMRQLYVKDPDGYVVCFQWPVERSS